VVKDVRYLASAYIGLAMYLQMDNTISEAADYLKKAITIDEEKLLAVSVDPCAIGYVYQNLGSYYF